MKKYVDWDKVEEGTEKETCECTRSKFQSFIDFIWTKSTELETDKDDLYRNPSKDFQVHRDEYERRNRDTESWMTRHDREYENWQKEEKKWQQ